MGKEPDFMIHGIVKYTLGGQELWLTDTVISMAIISLSLIVLGLAAKKTMKKASEVPAGFQNLLEAGVEMLEKMGTGIMGGRGRRFLNYVGSVFLILLFCNLSGLAGLRPPTADFGTALFFGIATFGLVQYQGIKNRGVRHFSSLFQPIPLLFPINLIGELTAPISLSLRLFANLLSGVIIMGLWYGIMPLWANIGIPAVLHGYCDLFSGCIQAYVFCMLTMVYLQDKME